MTSRTAARAALGAHALLTPREAAALLPQRDGAWLRWLHERGLVREVVLPDGSTVQLVRWGDVEREAMGGGTVVEQPRPETPGRVLRRRSLP